MSFIRRPDRLPPVGGFDQGRRTMLREFMSWVDDRTPDEVVDEIDATASAMRQLAELRAAYARRKNSPAGREANGGELSSFPTEKRLSDEGMRVGPIGAGPQAPCTSAAKHRSIDFKQTESTDAPPDLGSGEGKHRKFGL
jgi:hypothetical protein